HRVDITIHDWCSAVEPAVEQVLFPHLFKGSKRTALMGVEIEHLLLRDRAQSLHGCGFVCGPDRGPPTRDSDADQYAYDGDNDHQLDQRETALVLPGVIKGFHIHSPRALTRSMYIWVPISAALAHPPYAP